MSESRLIHERNHFSPGMMVSVAVGKKDRSFLISVDPGVKVTAQYYCDQVLRVMLPELVNLSGGVYTFQQDGVPVGAHCTRDSLVSQRRSPRLTGAKRLAGKLP